MGGLSLSIRPDTESNEDLSYYFAGSGQWGTGDYDEPRAAHDTGTLTRTAEKG